MRWVSSNYKRVDTAVFQNFYGIVAQDSLRSTLAPANFVEVWASIGTHPLIILPTTHQRYNVSAGTSLCSKPY